MGERYNVTSVASRFSRLYIDPNRPRDSSTLFRDTADGAPILLSTGKLLRQSLRLTITFLIGLSAQAREKRINLCYKPFHEQLCKVNIQEEPDLILSIHSFTPNYEGQTRKVEIGVLYQDDELLAQKFNEFFVGANYISRLNEPWSGKEGFMYSADQHSKRSFENLYEGIPKGKKRSAAIMLEMRQDLIVDAPWRRRVVELVEQFLKRNDVIELIINK